jgi:hypothetical protein
MLSLQEQYGVLEILDNNQIELVEHHINNTEEGRSSEQVVSENEDDEFELLYEDDIFLNNVLLIS